MSDQPVPIGFSTPFDAALAGEGPPSLFTVNARGELRLDPDRTRDGWNRCEPEIPDHETCHVLLRDRATGWVQYVLVTGRALVVDHPRADVRFFDDQASALVALAALGPLPLDRA